MHFIGIVDSFFTARILLYKYTNFFGCEQGLPFPNILIISIKITFFYKIRNRILQSLR
jgi:hypothetical protein